MNKFISFCARLIVGACIGVPVFILIESAGTTILILLHLSTPLGYYGAIIPTICMGAFFGALISGLKMHPLVAMLFPSLIIGGLQLMQVFSVVSFWHRQADKTQMNTDLLLSVAMLVANTGTGVLLGSLVGLVYRRLSTSFPVIAKLCGNSLGTVKASS